MDSYWHIIDNSSNADIDLFETWPVSDTWRAELNNVKATHDIDPLPAFATEDDTKLIDPTMYEQTLQGSTVLVSVSFRNHKLSSRNTGRLVACIEQINLLQSPAPIQRSPSKRKVREMLTSLSKKQRLR